MGNLHEGLLWFDDWRRDRQHDLERFAKEKVIKPLLGEAGRLYDDELGPFLKESAEAARVIISAAASLGVAAGALLLSEFMADIKAAVRNALADLQAKVDALKTD